MSCDKCTIWLVGSFLMFGLLIASFWVNKDNVAPEDLAYQVCNESRISPTIKEHGCAELLDQLDLRFTCEQRNTDPGTRCWVEEK